MDENDQCISINCIPEFQAVSYSQDVRLLASSSRLPCTTPTSGDFCTIPVELVKIEFLLFVPCYYPPKESLIQAEAKPNIPEIINRLFCFLEILEADCYLQRGFHYRDPTLQEGVL